MLLVSYRVLDVAAHLESHPELPTGYQKKGSVPTSFQVKIFFFLQFNNIDQSLQHYERLYDWRSLLSDFRTATGSSNPFIDPNNAVNETGSLNRHIMVLKKLKGCRGAVTSLINIQLAVISLHRMLNNVSLGFSIGLPSAD
jgi:hypothetical protein